MYNNVVQFSVALLQFGPMFYIEQFDPLRLIPLGIKFWGFQEADFNQKYLYITMRL